MAQNLTVEDYEILCEEFEAKIAKLETKNQTLEEELDFACCKLKEAKELLEKSYEENRKQEAELIWNNGFVQAVCICCGYQVPKKRTSANADRIRKIFRQEEETKGETKNEGT